MLYVFEGARNSGKTYLSTEISHIMGLPRFQFDFGKYFNLLGLESKDNREAHSFSMGKEMMLMQIARDINLGDYLKVEYSSTTLSSKQISLRIMVY